MAHYGIAVGITGSAKEPYFHLKTIKQGPSNCDYTPAEPQLITEQSFDKPLCAQLDNKQEIQQIISRFLQIVSEVAELQSQEQGDDAQKPIVLKVGTDGRTNFDNNFFQKLFLQFSNAATQKGLTTIIDLLNKVQIMTGQYNEGSIDRNGNYVVSAGDPNNVWLKYQSNQKAQERNKELEELKEAIEKKDHEAIQKACNYAYEFGRVYGYAQRNMDSRFAFLGSLYKGHSELTKLALFDFVSWHPEIKLAFRKGYSEIQGSKKTVVVKGIKEPYLGPFVDIVSCYIQDIYRWGKIFLTVNRQKDIEETVKTLKDYFTQLEKLRNINGN